MSCDKHPQNTASAPANTCPDSRRKRRKTPKTILRAVFGVCVPDAAEARTLLTGLRESTGFPRALLATLLSESQHAVRRWLDGSRSPSRAARWKIALFHKLLRDMNTFEIAPLLSERALKIATDENHPAAERIAALRLVPEMAEFQCRLGEQVLARATEIDAGDPAAA